MARKYLEEETAAEASYEDAEANRAEGNQTPDENSRSRPLPEDCPTNHVHTIASDALGSRIGALPSLGIDHKRCKCLLVPFLTSIGSL